MRKPFVAVARRSGAAGCASTPPPPPTWTCRPRPPAISSSIVGGRRSATRRSTSSSTRRSRTISTLRRRSPASSTAARRFCCAVGSLSDRRSIRRRIAVAHDPGRLQSAAVWIFSAVDRPCRRLAGIVRARPLGQVPHGDSGRTAGSDGDRIRPRDGAHDGRGRHRALLLQRSGGEMSSCVCCWTPSSCATRASRCRRTATRRRVIGEYDLRTAEAERASVAGDIAVARRAVTEFESALAVLLGRSPREVFAPSIARDVEIARLTAVPTLPSASRRTCSSAGPTSSGPKRSSPQRICVSMWRVTITTRRFR